MNRAFDFLRMPFDAGPCGREIGGAETGIVLEQIPAGHSLAAGLFKHPDGNAGLPDAHLPAAERQKGSGL